MADDLISMEHINECYFKYDDQRSCKNWLKVRGLSIIKLGKKYFVKEEQFKAVLNKICNRDKTFESFKNRPSKNILPAECIDIYDDLMKQINEL